MSTIEAKLLPSFPLKCYSLLAFLSISASALRCPLLTNKKRAPSIKTPKAKKEKRRFRILQWGWTIQSGRGSGAKNCAKSKRKGVFFCAALHHIIWLFLATWKMSLSQCKPMKHNAHSWQRKEDTSNVKTKKKKRRVYHNNMYACLYLSFTWATDNAFTHIHIYSVTLVSQTDTQRKKKKETVYYEKKSRTNKGKKKKKKKSKWMKEITSNRYGSDKTHQTT